MLNRITAVTAASLMLVATAALADDNDPIDGFFSAIPGEFSANVALATDYSFRGISQTGKKPAISGGFDWGHSIDTGGDLPLNLSVGTWASNVDFNDTDEASAEIDFYGSIGTEFEGLTFDINTIYYAYPGASASRNYDFIEVGPSVGYDFDFMAAGAGYMWSPDFFGGVGAGHYLFGDLSVPLPLKFAIDGHVGHSMFATTNLVDYTDWSLSLSRPVLGFDLSVSYYDTDMSEAECGSTNCEARAVFAVSRSF